LKEELEKLIIIYVTRRYGHRYYTIWT